MKTNYGIIAYTIVNKEHPRMSILHFCGYEESPTTEDFLNLTSELNTDEEFGLVGRIGVDVFLLEASPIIVKHFAADIERATTK